VIVACITALTFFIGSGYERIAAIKKQEVILQRKEPLANISICDDKLCIQVTKIRYTDKMDFFML